MRSPNTNEAVVLMHGLAAHRIIMSRLAKFLRARQYVTHNVGYRSTRKSIPDHAEMLKQRLDQIERDEAVERVHLVVHSMGSIITRCALLDQTPKKLGRIVMLGPPNAGSNVATRWSRYLGRVCQPLIELSDDPDSFVNQMQEPTDLEIGIIAAEKDRVVQLESSHLANQRDHIILPYHHSELTWRMESMRLILHFLRHGHFPRSKNGHYS